MNKLKVLIAEDEESTQQLFEKGLSDDIFDKRFASNGVEALEVYETWGPHIIILDIFMPIMTGFTVLKKIRQELKDTSTAIMICTALAQDEHIKDCIKLGIQGYIVKPFGLKSIGTEILKCYRQVAKKH